jgi:hypothetical protein
VREATEADIPFMQSILDDPRAAYAVKLGLEEMALPSAEFLLPLCKVSLHEDGFFVFTQVAERIYEVHTCFIPSGTFYATRRKMKESIAWLFTTTWAEQIVGRVHVSNTPAQHLAELAGFLPFGHSLEFSFWRMGLEDWMQTHPLILADAGAGAATGLGVPGNPHLDVIAGFIYLTGKAELRLKGLEYLSRHAILYGVTSLQVESWQPLTLTLNGNRAIVDPGGATCPLPSSE